MLELGSITVTPSVLKSYITIPGKGQELAWVTLSRGGVARPDGSVVIIHNEIAVGLPGQALNRICRSATEPPFKETDEIHACVRRAVATARAARPVHTTVGAVTMT